MELIVDTWKNAYGDEEPVAFELGDDRLTVTEIVDRWLSTERHYFKVRADNDATYILRHSCCSGEWDMTLFQRLPLPSAAIDPKLH